LEISVTDARPSCHEHHLRLVTPALYTAGLLYEEGLLPLSDDNTNAGKKSQIKLGRATSPLVMQRMDSSAACATSCSVPTVGESSHSAAGTLHPHRSATFFLNVSPTCVVRFPSPKKRNLHLPIRRFQLHQKKYPPSSPTHNSKQHH